MLKLNKADLSKWQARFLDLAHLVASYSKDPSTKCGAVITDTNNRIISQGYNGFPRGVADSDDRLNDRDTKYKMMVHAEPNAILNAARSVEGCTMYVDPFPPCSECAKLIIQSGITCVCCIDYPSKYVVDRWSSSVDVGLKMFKEASVNVVVVAR